jgi:hypothetical protein
VTFGLELRLAREGRGWSRFRLTVAIRERFRQDLTEQAIKLLELGVTRNPRGTTRHMLVTVLPELSRTYPTTKQ